MNGIQVSWIFCFVCFIILFGFSGFIICYENKDESDSIFYYLRRLLLFGVSVSLSQHIWLVWLITDPVRFVEYAADISRAVLVVCAHAALYKFLVFIAEVTATVSGTLNDERESIDRHARLIFFWWIGEVVTNIVVFILCPSLNLIAFTFTLEVIDIVSVLIFLLSIWPNLLRLHRQLGELCDTSSSLYIELLLTLHRRVRACIAAIGAFTILECGVIIWRVVTIVNLLTDFTQLPFFDRERGVDLLSYAALLVYSALLWAVWPRRQADDDDQHSADGITSSVDSNTCSSIDIDSHVDTSSSDDGGLAKGLSAKLVVVKREPSTSLRDFMLGIEAEWLAEAAAGGLRNSLLFEELYPSQSPSSSHAQQQQLQHHELSTVPITAAAAAAVSPHRMQPLASRPFSASSYLAPKAPPTTPLSGLMAARPFPTHHPLHQTSQPSQPHPQQHRYHHQYHHQHPQDIQSLDRMSSNQSTTSNATFATFESFDSFPVPPSTIVMMNQATQFSQV